MLSLNVLIGLSVCECDRAGFANLVQAELVEAEQKPGLLDNASKNFQRASMRAAHVRSHPLGCPHGSGCPAAWETEGLDYTSIVQDACSRRLA